MSEITVRALGLADRVAWAEQRQALWPNHPLDELHDELAAALEGAFAGFGAFDDSRLVGFAEVSERSYGDGCDSSPVAWLEGVYVLPEWRRGGIGRRLIAAVEGWARSRGGTELGSDAGLANVMSQLSHARWGFEETQRVVMFRKALT